MLHSKESNVTEQTQWFFTFCGGKLIVCHKKSLNIRHMFEALEDFVVVAHEPLKIWISRNFPGSSVAKTTSCFRGPGFDPLSEN